MPTFPHYLFSSPSAQVLQATHGFNRGLATLASIGLPIPIFSHYLFSSPHCQVLQATRGFSRGRERPPLPPSALLPRGREHAYRISLDPDGHREGERALNGKDAHSMGGRHGEAGDGLGAHSMGGGHQGEAGGGSGISVGGEGMGTAPSTLSLLAAAAEADAAYGLAERGAPLPECDPADASTVLYCAQVGSLICVPLHAVYLQQCLYHVVHTRRVCAWCSPRPHTRGRPDSFFPVLSQ